MDIKRDFVLRHVAGTALLVPTGRTTLDMNGMLTLNELGAEIWTMLPQAKNEQDIVARILEEYDATEEQVKQDVAAFLAKLRGLGIL